MFTAVKGGRAFLNNQPIHVAPTTDLISALVSMGIHRVFIQISLTLCQDFVSNNQNAANSIQSIRKAGAASLEICSVAMGRIDLYMETHVKVWDYSAAYLIAKEAGIKC